MFENELTALHACIGGVSRVLVTATEREDGDSVASELAMRHIIHQAFPGLEKTVHVVNSRACPPGYSFLNGADSIMAIEDVQDHRYDLGIVLDCGAERSGPVAPVFQRCPVKVKVDHHSFGNAGDYDIVLATNQVASTTEILFSFVGHPAWKTSLDRDLAELIFVGIISDTGAFMYDLTKPSTHLVAAELLKTGFNFPLTAERVQLARSYEMKKLLGLVLDRMKRSVGGSCVWSCVTREMLERAGACPGDVGHVMDEICFIRGVGVTVLFVEEASDKTRVSFRSKGSVNVGEFAHRIAPTGGGHPRASGCTIHSNMEDAVGFVLAQLADEIGNNVPLAAPVPASGTSC